MSKRTIALLILFVAVVVVGYGYYWLTTGRRFRISDEWYNPGPPGLFDQDRADDLSPVFEVSPPQVERAQRMLEHKWSVALSVEDAEGLADYVGTPGLKPYLVRALAQGEAGRFFAWLQDDFLIVCNASLGSGPGRLVRRPIIVDLPREPRQVYVTISVAK